MIPSGPSAPMVIVNVRCCVVPSGQATAPHVRKEGAVSRRSGTCDGNSDLMSCFVGVFQSPPADCGSCATQGCLPLLPLSIRPPRDSKLSDECAAVDSCTPPHERTSTRQLASHWRCASCLLPRSPKCLRVRMLGFCMHRPNKSTPRVPGRRFRLIGLSSADQMVLEGHSKYHFLDSHLQLVLHIHLAITTTHVCNNNKLPLPRCPGINPSNRKLSCLRQPPCHHPIHV